MDLSGDPGGGAFDDLTDLGLNASTMRIAGLIIRSGQFVEGITPIYLDGDGQLALPKHGGDGGLEMRLGLRPNEFITEISGRSGEFLDSLTLETNLGARIGFGGPGGSRMILISHDGQCPCTATAAAVQPTPMTAACQQ